MNAVTPLRATLAFLEAVFTVYAAGIGGVMINQVGNQAASYVWPSLPAVVAIGFPALLAGFRRLNALYQTP